MNDTTQTIEEEDDNDNRRASISNFENNRVALQCAISYTESINGSTKTKGIYNYQDTLKVAEIFKKWLNEA